MNERKSPDEGEQFNDGLNEGLNEDFGFGEAETEVRPIQTTTGQGSNKNLLKIILLLGVVVIGAMGYRFYSSTKHPSNTISQENSKKLTTVVSQNEAQSPTTTSQAFPASSTTTPNNRENTEPNFSDIAQAFSSADHPSNVVAPKLTTPPPSATGEGDIHQLQKELFAPEKVAEVPTAALPAHVSNTGISSQETEQLSQNLNKLNHQIDYILNQIKYLDSYTRDVSDNLNKLNDAINTMDARISAVTNATSTLSKDVGSVRSEIGQFKNVLQEDGLDLSAGTTNAVPAMLKKKSDQQDNKVTIEEPEYTVHAVIPGRAWLKSSKGQQIITVAEGDAIGNYGKILVIDAANGVVLTSSGIAFR